MKSYRFLPVITGLFTATLLIANTLDTKIFVVGGLALPAGITIFPLAYLAGDLLTEIYGYAASRKVIWTGFASLILMVLSYSLAQQLPPAAFWPNQDAFAAILGVVPRIVVASITAYWIGEFCNSFVLAKMKVRMEGRAMAWRFIASTLVGEFADTVVFVLIAFTGKFPVRDLVAITLSAWAVKVAWEIVALPVTLPLVRAIKRLEQEDFYDTNTNFNPFAVAETTAGRGTI